MKLLKRKIISAYNFDPQRAKFIDSDYDRIQHSDGFIDMDFAYQFDELMYNVATTVNCKFKIHYETDAIIMLCTTAKDFVFDIDLYDISSTDSVIQEVDDYIHDQEYFDSHDHNRSDILEVLYAIRDSI